MSEQEPLGTIHGQQRALTGVGGRKSYSSAWHCIPAYSESLAERETFLYSYEIIQQMIVSCACHFFFMVLT